MKNEQGYIPPTFRLVQDAYESAANTLLRIEGEADLIKLDDLVDCADAMTAHLSGEAKEATAHMLGGALVNVTELLKKHPESQELIFGAATAMILGGLRAVEELIFSASHAEITKVRPLLAINKQRSGRSDRAQTIATELWQADADQEFRLYDMAEQVKDILQREGFESLPKIERIKEWIKPVAPDYARKAGRSPKPPKRIG
ncbi:hypothetical protein [Pseudomonas sp. GWSMS-1]|uniref:hypothetical protein n=1 Tax=Pseudomonas sp. GWSMS-1 TaxID=3308997 RepID=UPI003CFA53B7